MYKKWMIRSSTAKVIYKWAFSSCVIDLLTAPWHIPLLNYCIDKKRNLKRNLQQEIFYMHHATGKNKSFGPLK